MQCSLLGESLPGTLTFSDVLRLSFDLCLTVVRPSHHLLNHDPWKLLETPHVPHHMFRMFRMFVSTKAGASKSTCTCQGLPRTKQDEISNVPMTMISSNIYHVSWKIWKDAHRWRESMVKYQRRQSSSYAWWAQRATLGDTVPKIPRQKAEIRQSQHRQIGLHPPCLNDRSQWPQQIVPIILHTLRTPSESKVSRGDTPPAARFSHQLFYGKRSCLWIWDSSRFGGTQLPLPQEYHRMTTF